MNEALSWAGMVRAFAWASNRRKVASFFNAQIHWHFGLPFDGKQNAKENTSKNKNYKMHGRTSFHILQSPPSGKLMMFHFTPVHPDVKPFCIGKLLIPNIFDRQQRQQQQQQRFRALFHVVSEIQVLHHTSTSGLHPSHFCP